MRRAKDFIVNCGLMLGSTIVVLLICEFVIFRFILLPSDVPANDTANGVMRYLGHQVGTWRVRDEIAARYAINAQGWNSGVGDYDEKRKPGVGRVAVVGDSYVEALQVAHTDSIGEHLRQELNDRGGRPTEVYRFGISGAPLSQYLYMAEREVARYRPDWIVVVLVHNDLNESFQFVPGRYTSSFFKLRVDDGKVVGDRAPDPWRPGMIEHLRRTAIARYFYYRWQVRPDTVRNAIFGQAQAAEGPFAANIDVAAVSRRMADIAATTDYLFVRLKTVAAGMGARLLVAMDGHRSAIYSGATMSFPLKLNRMAGEAAARHDIAFVDLHPVFAADWIAHNARFEFASDSHWNERAHALAARAISEAIRKR